MQLPVPRILPLASPRVLASRQFLHAHSIFLSRFLGSSRIFKIVGSSSSSVFSSSSNFWAHSHFRIPALPYPRDSRISQIVEFLELLDSLALSKPRVFELLNFQAPTFVFFSRSRAITFFFFFFGHNCTFEFERTFESFGFSPLCRARVNGGRVSDLGMTRRNYN